MLADQFYCDTIHHHRRNRQNAVGGTDRHLRYQPRYAYEESDEPVTRQQQAIQYPDRGVGALLRYQAKGVTNL